MCRQMDPREKKATRDKYDENKCNVPPISGETVCVEARDADVWEGRTVLFPPSRSHAAAKGKVRSVPGREYILCGAVSVFQLNETNE